MNLIKNIALHLESFLAETSLRCGAFLFGINNNKIDYSVINRIETLKKSIAGKTGSTNRKSGQCSASNNPVPKTSEIIWILVSGFVALAALLSRCGVIV